MRINSQAPAPGANTAPARGPSNADEARAALMEPDPADFEDDVLDDAGDDLQNDDAGDDTGVDGDAPAGEDDGDGYTPPTREEWEAMQQQHAMLQDLLGPEMDKIGQPDDDAPAEIDHDAIVAAMTPRQFELAPELSNRILVDGDADALAEYSKALIETVEHNSAIKINQAVLNGLKYAGPIIAATSQFYQRNPEMSGMRDLVERNMHQVRAGMPQANELQILRAVETRLKPIIDKAKQIAKQHAGQGGRGRNLAPAAPGGGQTPQPRGRAAGGGEPKPVSAAQRIQELSEFAGKQTYNA